MSSSVVYQQRLVSDAKTALSKRQVQKAENRILEVLPESKMTFNELAKWYLKLEKVKALKSYWLVEICLKKFNTEFGDRVVNTVKLADLRNYQAKRLKIGKAPATVDHEIGKTKTMVIKAFENDLVGGDVLKTFTRCKKTLKSGSDIRDRILTPNEFERLLSHANRHLRGVLTMAYYTGMRRGEILGLTWDKVDMQGRVIRLTADMTKDSEARAVPICNALFETLESISKAIHDNHVFLFRGKPVTHIRTGFVGHAKKPGPNTDGSKKVGSFFTTFGIRSIPTCGRRESPNRSSWRSAVTQRGKCSIGITGLMVTTWRPPSISLKAFLKMVPKWVPKWLIHEKYFTNSALQILIK